MYKYELVRILLIVRPYNTSYVSPYMYNIKVLNVVHLINIIQFESLPNPFEIWLHSLTRPLSNVTTHLIPHCIYQYGIYYLDAISTELISFYWCQ